MFGVVALVVASCGSGPEATRVAEVQQVCTDTFCAEVPSDWEIIDQGAAYVSFSHPSDPESVLATVGAVNMEGVVTANGGTWPQTVSGVVDVFWAAADGGDAELATSKVLSDGSVESFGAFGTGRMWARLIPLGTVEAIGVEMRAPNSSWETHARVLLDSVEPAP